ncbi:Oxoglutarate and iron-dependent oxygenase degradation C-term-domain-containing protein [Russula ochroleuca]|jgi:Rps23 Pro-64 3,4-dihydroxylase Tpa1-like proline 4-hydroxylase|uniref:uS12 prolyl 3,4-dihydroxylase n=1 Tax=Russula ochroleuca TaxID=152965 RepID=A0A9P5N261_9AGAM|nr:Oxoglutarate and iron-dependent oxygenase degradation C-term-domain-containing protein [Russula ochroleuca]
MAKTHSRSPSPEPKAAAQKKPKIGHESSATSVTAAVAAPPSVSAGASAPEPAASPEDVIACFTPDLLDADNVDRLAESYASGEPFKHALVGKLFRDEFLQKVKDECLSELHFTEKETDIYKVNQTGDLASLSYLTEQQVALLSNLVQLRNALYSPSFRNFLRAVTGCGPLSGVKQDMSVNTYRKGCHLLNHDDVIGTRRVSYILYMPLPYYQLWQKEWGGALELYPVKEGAQGVLEPEPVPAKSIPPVWNQFIFFEVQPGRSFHSVEEVVVGEGEDGWERLSISGWFHAAQPGEEGYEGDVAQSVPSSREQLTSTSTEFKSYSDLEAPSPDSPLTADEISFLSEFLNPSYLQPRTIKALASRFLSESSLELYDFLSPAIAEKLDAGLRELDERDGLGKNRPSPIPPHTAGAGSGWRIKGPPHKWRYNVLEPPTPGGRSTAVSPRAAQPAQALIRSLQDELFPAPAFRAWLAAISSLLPLRHAVEARRFCPGHGYTLATSEDKEARLDVVLELTPQVKETHVREGKARQPPPTGWQTGEWGGWECYMAPHDEEDDPAVYRSGSHAKSAQNGHGPTVNGNGNAGSSHGNGEIDTENSDDEDDDSTLLTVHPGFNHLLLVLRDEGVMRFVKYVSAAAEGSRWDVCGEYEVGIVEVDESDDD